MLGACVGQSTGWCEARDLFGRKQVERILLDSVAWFAPPRNSPPSYHRFLSSLCLFACGRSYCFGGSSCGLALEATAWHPPGCFAAYVFRGVDRWSPPVCRLMRYLSFPPGQVGAMVPWSSRRYPDPDEGPRGFRG